MSAFVDEWCIAPSRYVGEDWAVGWLFDLVETLDMLEEQLETEPPDFMPTLDAASWEAVIGSLAEVPASSLSSFGWPDRGRWPVRQWTPKQRAAIAFRIRALREGLEHMEQQTPPPGARRPSDLILLPRSLPMRFAMLFRDREIQVLWTRIVTVR